MGRSPASELTPSVSSLRQHINVILDEAISAVNAGRLVIRALDPDIRRALHNAHAVDVIAAGKAAAAMIDAFASSADVPVRTMLAIGPRRLRSSEDPALPAGTEWCDAGHPLPDEGSLAGAR